MDIDQGPDGGSKDDEVERLCTELKAQVQLAKARISDRYSKLVEDRSFEAARREG